VAVIEFDENAVLQQDQWLAFCSEHAEAYSSAQPFPHIVIDGFLPNSLIDQVVSEFPQLSSMRVKTNVKTGNKGSSADELQWGHTTRRIMGWLNSAAFLQGLGALTGIEGLLSDPYFEGGGLHQIGNGGFLKIHADFNIHKSTGLERRLNLLLYLNRAWPDTYGGHLELWDQKMMGCVSRIAPSANRCVIFSTTDTSYHGHPDPITCGPETTRKSLALYYYTVPEEKKAFHSTLYKERPGESLKKKGLRRLFRA